jgi:hypothetical protein
MSNQIEILDHKKPPIIETIEKEITHEIRKSPFAPMPAFCLTPRELREYKEAEREGWIPKAEHQGKVKTVQIRRMPL